MWLNRKSFLESLNYPASLGWKRSKSGSIVPVTWKLGKSARPKWFQTPMNSEIQPQTQPQLGIPENCLVFFSLTRDVALGWFDLKLVNLSTKVDWTWFTLLKTESIILLHRPLKIGVGKRIASLDCLFHRSRAIATATEAQSVTTEIGWQSLAHVYCMNLDQGWFSQ